MARHKDQGRGVKKLGGLEGRLGTYVAAAGATAGLLALPQPVSASIVYTPANHVFGFEQVVSIDLNHDGTVDFLIGISSTGIGFLNVMSGSGRHPGDKIVVKIPGQERFGLALKSGAVIGPSAVFNGAAIMVSASSSQGRTFRAGPWVNVKDRFLGLTFQVNGQVYYGWVEMSVRVDGGSPQAKLEGYAYNTVPNQPIQAGQKQDATAFVDPPPKAATLGVLALGSLGLDVWRKPPEESIAAFC